MTAAIRIGNGFDAHQIVPGDFIILCGVKIPTSFSLSGHSDADVGYHALADSMLGALGLDDIGVHFPCIEDNKGIDSAIIIRKVNSMLKERNYVVSNCDMTIIADKPKLCSYRGGMLANIALNLNIPISCVSVKFTTTNNTNIFGNPGIAAIAVSLVTRVHT